MAAQWGHTEMVEYLIKEGADTNKSAAEWSTLLTWAREKEHEEIEKRLVEAGARKQVKTRKKH